MAGPLSARQTAPDRPSIFRPPFPQALCGTSTSNHQATRFSARGAHDADIKCCISWATRRAYLRKASLALVVHAKLWLGASHHPHVPSPKRPYLDAPPPLPCPMIDPGFPAVSWTSLYPVSSGQHFAGSLKSRHILSNAVRKFFPYLPTLSRSIPQDRHQNSSSEHPRRQLPCM